MSLEEFDRALGLHTAVEVCVLWALPSQANSWELAQNDFLVPHKSTQRHCGTCAGMKSACQILLRQYGDGQIT